MIKYLFTSIFLFFSFCVLGQNFASIWNTNNTETGSSANNQISIPTNPSYTYNYSVDWGDGLTNSGVTGAITHDYATPGTYTIEISGTFPSIYFNDGGDKIKIIEILNWGNIQWQTMEDAFHGCENVNFDAIDAPDLTQVSSLQNMFRKCTSFNGIVNNWDISNITNISGLFQECEIFNRPVDLWNTSNVINMSYTFHRARNFNEPLDNWNVSSVTTLEYFLSEASTFNQNINNWNISNVTNLIGAFRYTGQFDQPLNNWDVSNINDLTGTFQGSSYNRALDNWNVSSVTSMEATFRESKFNQPLSGWDVSSVTNMHQMFHRNRTFNQPINNWDVSNVTDMSEMFDGWIWGAVFNQPLNNWNVSNVTNMEYMFRENSAFNQDISSWNVSNVTSMRGMFLESLLFNQDISNWDVSNVTNMSEMFQQTQAFNQPLNTWNMSAVTNVSSMFSRALVFNQPLDSWDMTGKSSLQSMFNQTTAFNQDISNWNTSGVINMSGMFTSATSFNQNLSSWDVSGVSSMNNMLSNSGLSQENYDNTLIGWQSQSVQNNVTLGATNLQYCDALTQRQDLINNNGWNITGDSVNCSFVLCTEITMPHASDTTTPANSDIRWNPAPNATGYRVTLEIERGGTRNYALIGGVVANNYDVGNTVGLDFSNEFIAGDTIYVTVVPYNAEGPATGCQEISFTVVESWVNSPEAFKLTYDTRILETGSTPANQLKIEANNGYPDYLTYNYSIDWGDGQYDNNVTGNITHTYLVPGIYTVAIIGDYPAPFHYYGSTDAIKLLSIDQWGTQIWQSMQLAFNGCENMEYNATDIPNLSQVENSANMFNQCYMFNGAINNWDVSNITNMSSMFISTRNFNQPLDSWNTSNVTNMYGMFGASTIFNQPLNSWNVSNVTNMNFMFAQTDEFNQDLSNWNTGNVLNMARMFQNSKAFNQPLNSWDVSKVTDMSEMFQRAEIFNQPLDSWDVSGVENMYSMFYNAELFNQNINSWDVSSVTNMESMFYSAVAFNEPLNDWNVSSVTNTRSMFYGATAFNQNIDSWNVTNVINMSNMFSFARNFNQPLNSWDVNSVVNMSAMFRGSEAFNQPLNNWDVSAVANMTQMFEDAVLFNQPINTWNVSSVTLMESMFENAEVYNQPMNLWNVGVVTNFEAMFKNAFVFDQPMSAWNTGEALTMSEMFYGATNFNQNINTWNTSFVTTMEGMFREASSFNQSLDAWNVASVNTMERMFQNASSFNSNIESWNVRGVNTMREMFSGATVFNQSINNWRISNVSDMDYMFNGASAYNQPMNLWNLGNVSMRSTFYNATSLNQSLADWDVSGVSNMDDMLDNTAITRENYDDTLITWSEQTLNGGITLGAEGLPYCDAQEERQAIIDNFGWTFSLDVRDCPIPECTQLVSPLNGDSDVPVNTNITWEATLFAQGYRLTVGTTSGGNDIVNNETITNETSYEFTSDFNTGDTVYVTLIPFNDEGDAIGPCVEESFTISNDPATVPECTNLTDPLSNATNVLVTTDLSWNAISNADGYKLTVGTSTGANDILDGEDVGNVSTHDFTNNLPEDSDIFVTIIPYNDQGDATVCTEQSFHTEIIPVPPTCTNLTSPLSGATDVAIDSHLSWTAISNATGYLVTVGTTSGGIEIVNNIDAGNVTTYDIPVDLQEDRLHYVTIIPYNNEGDATGCIEETFTTGDTSNSNIPPTCTTLNSPTNGASNVNIATTQITWNAVANATGYRVTITGTTNNNVTDVEVGTNSFILPGNFIYEDTAVVNIIPFNGSTDATGCFAESFTIESAPPPSLSCTTLNSPSNGDTNVAVGTSQMTWNAVTNATGYRITITGTANNNITNAEVTTNSYTFPGTFINGETATVTIIPFNATDQATGCSSESFTIEAGAAVTPACTTLNSPSNGDTNVVVGTSQMTWNAITNATGYRITITGTANNNIVDAEVTTNSYTFPGTFINGETATVTIIPFNATDQATGCSSESFTIEAAAAVTPNCTTLNSPSNGDTNVAVGTSQMTWSAVTNATEYRITITGTANNNITDAEVTTNSYTFPGTFINGETATVTIIPFNATDEATGCSTESFTIENLMPETPDCTSLINPTNGDTNVEVNTNFSWNAITNATGYRISIGTTSRGTDIVNNQDVGLLTSYSLLENLPNNSTIYTTIIAYNGSTDAINCDEQSFTTIELTEDETKYGFSPNGDGINDYWIIDGIENYPDNEVYIYNRWGDIVFETKGYDNNSKVFHGSANKLSRLGANTLPSGTYFFNIKISGQHNLRKTKGYLVIQR